MTACVENLHNVHSRINKAISRSGRRTEDVKLIAVSKTYPAENILEVFQTGQRIFGESRLQEAEEKLAILPSKIEWHFIGRIQSNKVRRILPLFDVLHGIDSLRLAQHVDFSAKELGLYPKIFLQVNVAEEETKAGFSIDEISQKLGEILKLDRLEILGLMTIPPASDHAEDSRKWFVKLRELRDRLQLEHHVSLSSLSMGMSSDYEIAIEEGATHVRVGSAIFGKRGSH